MRWPGRPTRPEPPRPPRPPARRTAALAALLALLALIAVPAAASPSRKRPGLVQGLFKKQTRLTGELHELRHCNESAVAHMLEWTQRTGRQGEIFVDGTLLVRALLDPASAKATFIKCTEYGTACEQFLVMRFGREACGLWTAKNMFWTPIRNSIRLEAPPHHLTTCPISPGRYLIRNATIDFDRITDMCPYPLSTSVWSIFLEFFQPDGSRNFCGVLRGKLIRYASRGVSE